MSSPLTTTSYAVLGQLALRPWTMYELAAEMRRNVHFFFPRVESQVYAEPKRLVSLGLAEAATEMIGKRRRTTYSITRDGTEALRLWLATPLSKGPLLEFEALLRVMLAPFGTDDDLRHTLEQAREDIGNTILRLAPKISDEYVAGVAPFQRYAQYRSIMHDFLLHFGMLIDDWADRSLEHMKDWPHRTDEERRAAGVAVFDRNRPRHKRPSSR